MQRFLCLPGGSWRLQCSDPGFSASLVTTEVALDGRSLDVLVIDDAGRNYIAIENKFGAQQSSAQLSHYRKHLEKLFPDFTGVHIFWIRALHLLTTQHGFQSAMTGLANF